MISMSTETDRTLFFDFMPMELGTIAGQKVRVQLYTVPGQVFYDATRKLVLRGADGVVFVADSQDSMRGSNIESLENLKTNLRLNRLDPNKVAIVLQYNKRDLPNVDSVEEMNEYLNPDRVPFVEAAARDGIGVTATLRAAVAKILDNVKNNVDTTLYEAPELTAPDMSAKSGVAQHSAGTPKLSMRSESVSAPPAAPPPPPAPAPMAVSPFESAFHATAVEEEPEEDPFGAFAVVAEPEEEADDPFAASATAVHEVNPLLASARDMVESLERALDAARKHEQELLKSTSGV
jgi:signal recognition particle receptor subunit beta